MDNNSFQDFLKHTLSQKEISLVIAQDETELKALRETLLMQGYQQVIDGSELVSLVSTPTKAFYQIEYTLPKVVYDFLLQYPTGQIEQCDRNLHKSTIVTPIYEDSAFLLLTTKEMLSKAEQNGFQVLPSAGLTYQR